MNAKKVMQAICAVEFQKRAGDMGVATSFSWHMKKTSNYNEDGNNY